MASDSRSLSPAPGPERGSLGALALRLRVADPVLQTGHGQRLTLGLLGSRGVACLQSWWSPTEGSHLEGKGAG